ncbi:MAG: hypothetical protein ACJAZO_003385 [Myxococcota bacterium]|jgi:hypothetical protein
MVVRPCRTGGTLIIFGTHKFGWVDEVEGLGWVATSFIHVMYVPLIPMSSYFIFADDSDRGVVVPLNGKSVIVAYTRAMMFWTALLCTVAAIVSSGLTCCCAVPAWGIYFAMPFLLRPASEARAAELREMLVRKMDIV